MVCTVCKIKSLCMFVDVFCDHFLLCQVLLVVLFCFMIVFNCVHPLSWNFCCIFWSFQTQFGGCVVTLFNFIIVDLMMVVAFERLATLTCFTRFVWCNQCSYCKFPPHTVILSYFCTSQSFCSDKHVQKGKIKHKVSFILIDVGTIIAIDSLRSN